MSSHRIGLVGCGNWGANHLRCWAELGALAAVCDADPLRLADVRARFPQVTVYANLDELLARDDLAGIVVATPAPTHAPIAIRALERGFDVLIEKPMALTAHEGVQIIAAARSRNRMLMVGHVLEYHPAVVHLHRLVQEGQLGRVQYVYSNRLNFGRIRVEENALWSFAPHDIALMNRLVGQPPDSVSCHGAAYLDPRVSDVTLTSLSYPGGVRGHIYVSWLHPFKEHRYVVVGDRQMAVFDDGRGWGEKLLLYPHRVDWLGGRVPVANKAEAVSVALEAREPLREECLHFLACIAERRTPLTDGVSGLSVLEVLAAAQRSIEDGGRPQSLGRTVPPHVAASVEIRESPPVSKAPIAAPDYVAHPTAVIDAGATIGSGTRIWHFSHVMGTAVIGKKCILGQNAFVGPRVKIGDGVKIQNNVSLYEGVELEDYVFCGPSMVFTNVMNPRSAIERKEEFRPTRVGRGASLGANCTIVCGNEIGRYAFIGAGSVVSRPVAPYALMVGVPARRIGWICECGERLVFDAGRAKCGACGLAYRESGKDKIEPTG